MPDEDERGALDDRVERAATARVAIQELAYGVYQVTTPEGDSYRCDPTIGVCTCPDYEYRVHDQPDVVCKHVLAVVFRCGPGVLDAPLGRPDPDVATLEEDVVTDGGRDMAAYTLEELRGYMMNCHATGTHGEVRVDRSDQSGVAARVETEDERLRFELEGAGFPTTRVDGDETEFYVHVLDEPFEYSYRD